MLEKDLEDLLNRYSAESSSDTPDFVLAEYLTGCLEAFNRAVNAREKWYGRITSEVANPPSEVVTEPKPKDALRASIEAVLRKWRAEAVAWDEAAKIAERDGHDQMAARNDLRAFKINECVSDIQALLDTKDLHDST